MDLQAQARAHRLGQSQVVLVLRLVTLETVEERILERARGKLDMESRILESNKFKIIPFLETDDKQKESNAAGKLTEADILQVPEWSRSNNLLNMLESQERLDSFIARDENEMTKLSEIRKEENTSISLYNTPMETIPEWMN